MDMKKIEMNYFKLVKKKFDLRETINQVIDLFEDNLIANGVTIK